jgi:HAD superfamily hydrolase (TIGR01490 family)
MRSAYAQFVYHVGGADHDQMERMREFLSALCAGWDVQTVRDIVAETLHNVVDPLVYDEAVSLMEEHRAAGRDVVIVSASGTELVEPIGEMLGADAVVATQMRIEDGRYTGEIDYYAYGVNKAVALRRLAGEHGYDLSASYAYSDSATDLPMLEVVGQPHVVNPDKALRREAAERGWPILEFRRPVSLRDRLGRLSAPSPRMAGAAVGAGMVAGVAWWVTRRTRRGSGA